MINGAPVARRRRFDYFGRSDMQNKNILRAASLCGALLAGVGSAFAENTPTASAPTVAPSPPAVVPDRVQLEKRLESVKTLLETSSAAKQIEAGGDANAKAEHAKAMDIWREAKAAFDSGDLANTQKLLLEAPKMLFAAARHSSNDKVSGEKLRNDYLSRRESVKALLSAQQRISDEKGKVSGAEQVAKNVEQLLIDAEQLANSGKYVEARAVADKAYLLAKASVGEMRSGDTLVRSLNFANKAEEYKYEHDRNDSLSMLYKVLVEQKGTPSANVAEQFKKGMDLRSQAEKAAAEGDHASGVKLLEDATSQLIRAIRSAGIFIPG